MLNIILVSASIFTLGCNTNKTNHSAEAEEAVPSFDTTIWTGNLELFVEFKALVVGQPSTFAAHFTTLNDHKPVQKGTLTVSLGKDLSETVEGPASPGIFIPTITPVSAGRYNLTFALKTDQLSEQITLPNVPVFGNVEEAQKALPKEPETGISFLKEQAWKIDFHTEPVREDSIYDMIQGTGIWRTAPTGKEVVVATTSGIIQFANNTLTEGASVRSGEILMTIGSQSLSSDNQSAAIQQAKADWDKARSEYLRKKELHESRVISTAAFEAAEQQYRVAKSAYETLSAGYSSSGKRIKTPFTGVVRSLLVENGDYVKQGDPLFSVSVQTSNLLEVQVSQQYASQLQSIRNIWYQPRNNSWSDLKQSGGNVLSVSRKVDTENPMISVYASIRDVVDKPEGSFTQTTIAVGAPRKSTVIPTSALLEDYGTYYAIVQSGGEQFEKRVVQTGRQNGSYIEILDGIMPGEMIVSKGAYQVKMASMSGQAPAHGHAH